MIISRRLPLRAVVGLAAWVMVPAMVWAGSVLVIYRYTGLSLLRVPFLPIATVGTAVAFYVGFKNNSSYDRFWEGRKIWGGIVNASRTWGACVASYIAPGDQSAQAQALRRALIYRHLAWINALRLQLRRSSRFFHKPARTTRRRLERHADAMRNNWEQELAPFLPPEELAASTAHKNAATQLLARQSQELASLVREARLDLFHQLALMEVIEECYTLQGQCERIKNTPFPRIYAEYSRVFTSVFVLLVPLGLLDVFAEHIDRAADTMGLVLASIPMLLASALITWVFSSMESIGDATEDPFERSMNDVPMNALCRTIEIDLRELLGESDLPDKEPPADNILY